MTNQGHTLTKEDQSKGGKSAKSGTQSKGATANKGVANTGTKSSKNS